MSSLLKLVLIFICLGICSMAVAQPAMADAMRAEGKIYVVVGVIAIIFALFVLYLVSIDRRLRKAERESK